MTTTNRKILSFEQSDVTIPRARRRPSYNAVVAIAMAKEGRRGSSRRVRRRVRRRPLCVGMATGREGQWKSDGEATEQRRTVSTVFD